MRKYKMMLSILLSAVACAGGWYYQHSRPKRRPPSIAEIWLAKQARDATVMNLQYGSTWAGSLWYETSTRNHRAIESLVGSIRCTGDLPTANNEEFDGDLLGYNTSYYIQFGFKHKPAQYLFIFVVGGQHAYGITRMVVSPIRGASAYEGMAFMEEDDLTRFLHELHQLKLKFFISRN